jgi:hypothetical protein
MDITVRNLREQIFGAKNLTTQDVVEHFKGNTNLAEAYLNGLIDWAGNIMVHRFVGEEVKAS